LESVGPVQRLPQVHGRGEDDVRVADDVNEAGGGEQLQQGADAAGGRRRLGDEGLWGGGGGGGEQEEGGPGAGGAARAGAGGRGGGRDGSSAAWPCGGRLGKAMLRYGDGCPIMHRANSSSCGRSQPAAMLSIGRRDGNRKPSQRVNSSSVSRK